MVTKVEGGNRAELPCRVLCVCIYCRFSLIRVGLIQPIRIVSWHEFLIGRNVINVLYSTSTISPVVLQSILRHDFGRCPNEDRLQYSGRPPS